MNKEALQSAPPTMQVFRQAAKEFVDERGWDELLKSIQEIFANYGIYKISKEWYDSDDYYTIKGKGTNGDISIRLL